VMQVSKTSKEYASSRGFFGVDMDCRISCVGVTRESDESLLAMALVVCRY
jgi:hypothetical protein